MPRRSSGFGSQRAHTSWPASALKLEALEVNQAGRFYQFFKNVEHSMTCEREKGAAYMFHATPRFLKPGRAALERVRIPTLIVLQEEVGGDGRCLTLWNDVALAMGIAKEALRQRYRLDRKRCSLTLTVRNSGGLAPKESIGTQCESVFYCDRICQKR